MPGRFRFPTASAVCPDFHDLAVLDPKIGANPNKRGHSHFNLKLRANGENAVSFHDIIIWSCETHSGGLQTTPFDSLSFRLGKR